MLKVDFRRMFTMPLLYIMVGICLIIPILILVMTTMMDGSVSVNPQTGEETVMEGVFESVNITSMYAYFNEFGKPTPVYHQSTYGAVNPGVFNPTIH